MTGSGSTSGMARAHILASDLEAASLMMIATWTATTLAMDRKTKVPGRVKKRARLPADRRMVSLIRSNPFLSSGAARF